MALQLAPRFMRVNAIHPTNCNTTLSITTASTCVSPRPRRPDLEDARPAFVAFQAMPIPYVEPVDIANLGVFLASDESRYITGQQIRVDAGSLLKFPNGRTG